MSGAGGLYDHYDTDPFEPVETDEDEEDDLTDFEDFGYAGGGEDPNPRFSAEEIEERAKQYGEPTCELDINIIRLLVFHPEINVRLRTGWQNILPESDKRVFLKDLHFALGVERIGEDE